MEAQAAKRSHPAAVALARACGGAFVFAVPLFMTMEMWELGFMMDRLRLAGLVVATLPLLYRLSYRCGFNDDVDWRENLLDAFGAFALGWLISASMLLVFGVIQPGMPVDEWVGKITLQAIPASMGAMVAGSQFGEQNEEREPTFAYGPDLLLAAAGALFLGLSVAPTEEMVLIAFQMTPWKGIALVLISVVITHGFALATEAKRQRIPFSRVPPVQTFFRATGVFYSLALVLSAYLLWSFGQIDSHAPETAVLATVVLGFPASLGASAARLLL